VQYYLRSADLGCSQELRKRIGTLAQRHELSNIPRLHRASAQQIQLTHRLLRLVQHLHLLIPTLRSSSIRPEEEALRTALEEIDDEIRRPGGMGRMRGKLNELWALIGAVKAVRERGVSDGNVEWAVVDEEGLAQIAQVRFPCRMFRFCGDLTTFFKILSEQQAGLALLTKTLQKDLNDLAVIKGTAGPVDMEMS
jgi:nuclear pore complex protein Nup54